jgi:SH3-like domain-containing protein
MSRRVLRYLWILTGLVALVLAAATVGLIARARAQVRHGVAAQLAGGSSLFHLREQPAPNSRIVAILERGTTVTVTNSVTENDYTWYRVQAGEQAGWIQAQYVRLDTP